MAEDKVKLEFDNFEQRLLVNGMNEWRTNLLKEGKPTEDVDELLLKIINAPKKRRMIGHER